MIRKKTNLFKTYEAMLAAAMLLTTAFPAFGQTAYNFQVVAQTGQPILDPNPDGGGNTGPLVDLGRGPSINNTNSVAFIARLAARQTRPRPR